MDIDVYHSIVEAAPDALIVFDDANMICFVNATAESMFGRNRTNLIGSAVTALIDPASDTANRRDGTLFPITLTASEVAGDPPLRCYRIHDLTETVRLQTKNDLLDARLRASERMESLGRLAGGVAHDFNNMLAVILNYADFVADSVQKHFEGCAESGGDAILTDIETIRQAGTRAAAMTRMLLIFGRRDLAQPEPLTLPLILQNLGSLLRQTIGEDIVLNVDADPATDTVFMDRTHVEQIILNLTVNAREAMSRGGSIDIRVGNKRIDLGDKAIGVAPGPYVVIAVSDTGRGMTPDVTARAMEPFFTTKAVGTHPGLGLTTVDGIVAAVNGRVTISSEPDAGTTVTIYLPSHATEAAAQAEPVDLRGRGETIAIAEDEFPVGELARRILTDAGYTVLLGGDPKVTLTLLDGHDGPIDLLLTDVVMPGMTGKELALHVAAAHPAIKIVYMSGYAQEVIARQGILDPGVTLLEKPFSRDKLLHAVRTTLDRPANSVAT